MITKEQVLEKLDTLKEYSVEQDPATEPFFEPVYTAVNSYFSVNPSLEDAMRDVIKCLYMDIINRTTISSNHLDYGLPTNFPKGYNDLEKCFYQFASIFQTSEKEVFDAFIYGVPETSATSTSTSGAGQKVPTSNPLLTEWTAEITAAPQTDVDNLNAIAEFCKSGAEGSSLIRLFEDPGKLEQMKSASDLANIIYIERKATSVIKARKLKTHIPTYLKE